jgi:hypothetical protein
MLTSPLRYLLALSLCVLAGCQRPTQTLEPVAAETVASSASVSGEQQTRDIAVGATQDTMEALMREVFEGWDSKTPYETEEGDALAANFVVSIDADHRALVAASVPASVPEGVDGQSPASHGTPGRLVIYGFEKREGRWFQGSEWSTTGGTFGNVGEVHLVQLGSAHQALAIENGGCWQGYCGRWLELVELASGGARPLLERVVMTSSSSTGATEGCEHWLVAAGDTGTAHAHPKVDSENCFDVNGKWRVGPVREGGWPDVVISFKGKDVATKPKTRALFVRDIEEELVLRHDGTFYQQAKGLNPTHGF